MAEFPSWQQGLRQAYPPLRGNVRFDAVIVGGGFTGVLTALMLSRCGVKTALVERDILGHGATFGCSGLITSQVPQIYRRIAALHSLDTARLFARLTEEAVLALSQLADPIRSARLTERSVYLYAETADDLPALESLLKLEQSLGLSVTEAPDAGGCPFPVELSAVMHRQYTVSPLPFLLHLAEEAVRAGCVIHEHTPVVSLQGTHLQTPDGALNAGTMILCSGLPPACRTSSVLSLMQPRLMEARILRCPVQLHSVQRSVQADEPGFLPVHEGLLMTLDRGRYGTRQASDSRIIRDRTLRALLPEARTTDVILRREYFTCDGLPLIGPVEPRDGRVLMAGGYNMHGLTGACMAARTLCSMILGYPEPHSALFQPFRSIPGKSMLVQPLKHAARRRLRRYLHFTAPRCSHMGCPLRYNPAARQWECPCHGASFDLFGKALSAPAVHRADLSPKDRPV